jgi:hypothetical protein
MKKFVVTLLMGAFLFTSLAATIGCTGEEKDKAKDKAKDTAAKDKDKADKKDK